MPHLHPKICSVAIITAAITSDSVHPYLGLGLDLGQCLRHAPVCPGLLPALPVPRRACSDLLLRVMIPLVAWVLVPVLVLVVVQLMLLLSPPPPLLLMCSAQRRVAVPILSPCHLLE
jgi:hypothetical protein